MKDPCLWNSRIQSHQIPLPCQKKTLAKPQGIPTTLCKRRHAQSMVEQEALSNARTHVSILQALRPPQQAHRGQGPAAPSFIKHRPCRFWNSMIAAFAQCCKNLNFVMWGLLRLPSFSQLAGNPACYECGIAATSDILTTQHQPGNLAAGPPW